MQAAIDKGETRSDPRSNVFLMATIGAGTTSNPVKVRNLSVHGALLEGAALPPTGTAACLRRGSLHVDGVIAWRDRTHCGMRFQSPIEVDEWVRRVGAKEQQTIDAAIAQIRAGSPGQRPALISARSRRDLLASASAELRGSASSSGAVMISSTFWSSARRVSAALRCAVPRLRCPSRLVS